MSSAKEQVGLAGKVSSSSKPCGIGRLLEVLDTRRLEGGDGDWVLPDDLPVFCGDQSLHGTGKSGLLRLWGSNLHGPGTGHIIWCQSPGCSHDGGMSPQQFEAHSGRGSAKKWKESIRLRSWPPGVPPPLLGARAAGPKRTAAAAGGANLRRPSSPEDAKSQQKLTQFFRVRSARPAVDPSSCQAGPQGPPQVDASAVSQPNRAAGPVELVDLTGGEEDSSPGSAEAAERAAKAAERRLRKRKRARVMKEGQLAVVVYGASEEMIWSRRLAHFTETVRAVLGDRRFNVPWGGSVVDSVVGTYLTQNVSDTLSSQAYMTLVSAFRHQASTAPQGGQAGVIPHRAHSVNWMEVRTAPVAQIESAIRCRGFQAKLTTRIQSFLSHVILDLAEERLAPHLQQQAVRLSQLTFDDLPAGAADQEMTVASLGGEGQGSGAPAPQCRCGSSGCHGDVCLEWLRGLPGQEANAYLTSCGGLGRKSCACISLLTLGHKDFPVDVNVGRICARLGWIPLDSESALEELDEYAPEPLVHAFLRSRLLGLMTLQQLYELHYQMITLGKVFCSKKKPNCSACPLQSVCEYALAGGPRLDLRPIGPQQTPQASAPAEVSEDPRADLTTASPAAPLPGAALVFEALGAAEDVIGSVLAAAAPMYDNSASWDDKRDAAMRVLGASPVMEEAAASAQGDGSRLSHETGPGSATADFIDLTDEALDGAYTAGSAGRVSVPQWQPRVPAGSSPSVSPEALLAPETPTKASEATASRPPADCLAASEAAESPAAELPSPPGGSHRSEGPPPARGARHWNSGGPQGSAGRSESETSHDQSGGVPHALRQLVEAVAEAGRAAELESFCAGSGSSWAPGASDGTRPTGHIASPPGVPCSPGAGQEGQPASPETPVGKDEAGGVASSASRRLFQAPETDKHTAKEAHSRPAAPPGADGSPDGSSVPASGSSVTPERRLQLRYHSMGRLLHPDKCSVPMAQQAFAAVSRAYSISVTTYQTSWRLHHQAAGGPTAPPAQHFTAGDKSAAPVASSAGVGTGLLVPSDSACAPGLPGSDSTEAILTGLAAVEASGVADPSLAGNRLRRRFGAFEISEEVLLDVAPWLPPRLPEDPGRVLAFLCPQGAEGEAGAVINLCAEPLDDDLVDICLLVPCRSALLGRFPLNGTYFQVNELFADRLSLDRPLRVPRASLHRPGQDWPRLCQVYSGVSVPSICRGMQTAEVAELFSRAYVCIRAFDSGTGAPSPLPSWMMPQRLPPRARIQARPHAVAAAAAAITGAGPARHGMAVGEPQGGPISFRQDRARLETQPLRVVPVPSATAKETDWVGPGSRVGVNLEEQHLLGPAAVSVGAEAHLAAGLLGPTGMPLAMAGCSALAAAPTIAPNPPAAAAVMPPQILQAQGLHPMQWRFLHDTPGRVSSFSHPHQHLDYQQAWHQQQQRHQQASQLLWQQQQQQQRQQLPTWQQQQQQQVWQQQQQQQQQVWQQQQQPQQACRQRQQRVWQHLLSQAAASVLPAAHLQALQAHQPWCGGLQGPLHFNVSWGQTPAEGFWTADGRAGQRRLQWAARRPRTPVALRPRQTVAHIAGGPEPQTAAHLPQQLVNHSAVQRSEIHQDGSRDEHNRVAPASRCDHQVLGDLPGCQGNGDAGVETVPEDSAGDQSTEAAGHVSEAGRPVPRSAPGPGLALPAPVTVDPTALEWLRSKQAARAAGATGVLWMGCQHPSDPRDAKWLWPVRRHQSPTQGTELPGPAIASTPATVLKFSEGAQAAPHAVPSGALKQWGVGLCEVVAAMGPSCPECPPALAWAIMQAHDFLRASCWSRWWEAESRGSQQQPEGPSVPRKQKKAAAHHGGSSGQNHELQAVPEADETLLEALRGDTASEIASCNNVMWGKVKGFRFWPCQIVPEAEVQRRPDFSARGSRGTPACQSAMRIPVQFFGTSEMLWLLEVNVKTWGEGVSSGGLKRLPRWRDSNPFVTALQEVYALLVEDRPPSDKQWWDRAGRRAGLRSQHH